MKSLFTRMTGIQDLSEKVGQLLADSCTKVAHQTELIERKFDNLCGRVEATDVKINALEMHLVDLRVEISALRADFAREMEQLQERFFERKVDAQP